MIERVEDRIARMEKEAPDRFARAQRYQVTMNDQPSLPLVATLDDPDLVRQELESNRVLDNNPQSKPFDKKRYQREYMRTRRAAQKQGAR